MSGLKRRHPSVTAWGSVKVPRLDPPQRDPLSILDLNDDCIRLILQYLKATEAVHFGLIDGRIRELVGQFPFQDSSFCIELGRDELSDQLHQEYGRVVRKLKICSQNYSEDAGLVFPWYPRLKYLRLDTLKLDVSMMRHFPENLKHLEIAECRVDSSDVWEVLRWKLEKSLTSIYLHNTVPPKILLPKLERMIIKMDMDESEDYCRNQNLDFLDMNASTIRNLSLSLCSDEYEYVCLCGLPDNLPLSKCTQLRGLNLHISPDANLVEDHQHLFQVLPVTLKHLQIVKIGQRIPQRLVHLKTLWVSKIVVHNLELITGLPHLEKLAIFSGPTNYDRVQFILRSFPQLECLVLKKSICKEDLLKVNAFLQSVQRGFLLTTYDDKTQYIFGWGADGQWQNLKRRTRVKVFFKV